MNDMEAQQESPTLLDSVKKLITFCEWLDHRGGLGIEVHEELHSLVATVKEKL